MLSFPPVPALVVHLLLVGGCAALAISRHAPVADLTPLALVLIATLVTGPIGAAYAICALFALRRSDAHPERLDDWYERIALAGTIDPVTQLSDTVAMGRAVLTGETVPRAFEDVMSTGSLADRQTALGMIARRFSPAYAPALKAALVGEEPVIRVQAAAVAVKARGALKASVRTALASGDQATTQAVDRLIERARSLQDMIGSGLLDDDDRASAKALAGRLMEAVSDAVIAGRPVDPGLVDGLETVFLSHGKLTAFRTLRARHSLPAGASATVEPAGG